MHDISLDKDLFLYNEVRENMTDKRRLMLLTAKPLTTNVFISDVSISIMIVLPTLT